MFSFCIPTEFVFGTGCFKELHKYNLPGKKALIVITNGKSIRNSGYLAELENQLSLAGKEYEVFDGITPNPTTDSIMDAAKTAKDSACDFIIGFGGGSPMDSAKLIALAATNPGNIWDYCQKGSGGRKLPANQPLPVVCISTTAGNRFRSRQQWYGHKSDHTRKIGHRLPKSLPRSLCCRPGINAFRASSFNCLSRP